MWSTVDTTIFSLQTALVIVGVGSNVFQTVNKAAVAQHAPPDLVGTIMGMSGTWERYLALPVSIVLLT